MTLPKPVTDALEILLITKDNLAGYHRELVEHFILDEKWGRWIGRWTAEEHLHAVALRNYLVVTREIDPAGQRGRPRRARDEGLPRRHATARSRRWSSWRSSSARTPCSAATWPAQIDEPVLKRPGRPDRHATRSATRSSSPTWSRTAWTTHRDETVAAIATRAAALDVGRRRHRRLPDKVAAVAEAGIFDDAALRTVDLRPHHRVGSGRAPRARGSSSRSSHIRVTARLTGGHAAAGVASHVDG